MGVMVGEGLAVGVGVLVGSGVDVIVGVCEGAAVRLGVGGGGSVGGRVAACALHPAPIRRKTTKKDDFKRRMQAFYQHARDIDCLP